MESVFKHLEKKWKVIVDHSHELSLIPSTRTMSTALYQHNCNEMSIKEFCGRMDSITVVFYRWEIYSVDTEPIDFDETMLVKTDVEKDERKEDELSFMQASLSSTQGNNGVNDPIFSSQSLSWDSQYSLVDDDNSFFQDFNTAPIDVTSSISFPVSFAL